MSVNQKLPSADTIIPHRASQPLVTDLEVLDQRLKRLSGDVFPLHPYLLTLPMNAPFRLGSRTANNWAVGRDCPFTPEEQQLQYTTFLTHHDTDSLLVAVGDWADETGRMMIDQTAPQNTTENPKETVSKKKISLKDYKTQKTGSTGTPPAVHDLQHQHELLATKREGTTQLSQSDAYCENNQAESNNKSNQPRLLHSPDKALRKRPSTSDSERVDFQPTVNPEMHSPKRSRLSPERELRKDNISAHLQSPRLPALLSPTLPPTKIPLSPTLPPATRLPRLLSPTLPPDLEKELAKLENHSPASSSPRRDATASESRRDDELRSRTPTSTTSHNNSSSRDNRIGVSSKDTTIPRHELLVRLRYGKANRRRVEALLKFSGKGKAHRSISPCGQDGDRDEARTGKKKAEAGLDGAHAPYDKLKSDTKHKPDETQDHGARHPREHKNSAEKGPTTTLHSRPAAQDPVKANSLTPGKDSKGSLGRRNDFADVGGKTPSNPANKRQSVDPGMRDSPVQRDGRPSNNERRVWRDEYQKFSNIGRELKHSAERYNSGASVTAENEKLAVVTAIEALLCFILAFVADDQAKVVGKQIGDSSTWVSILAYWRVVRKNSAPFPVLYSLCLVLGAVSYGAIHTLDLDRLANSPLPGEHTPVPTPGSDGNAILSDENKKSHKDFLELKNRLPESYRESQKLWLEGMRALSEDVLRREFPQTWSQRSRNFAERGKMTLKAGDYAGDYFLPLGGTNSPIEVVRFGCSLLKEWCTEENVEWERRLSL